jgi:osmotically-inducible protein OsmY
MTDQQYVPSPYCDDTEIEQTARQLLEWSAAIPLGTVTASVHDQAITLTGTVTWAFQRDAAARAVRDIFGISTVRNEIAILRNDSVLPRLTG